MTDAIAIQLICHAVGDYVLQNHWMANEKTISWPPAAIHALLYTVPFLVMFGWNPAALGVICGTHAIIDRYRLANLWVKFWGTGCEGWVLNRIQAFVDWRKGPAEEGEWRSKIARDDAPPWLGVWLMIIVDNVCHVIINALALHYLGSL